MRNLFFKKLLILKNKRRLNQYAKPLAKLREADDKIEILISNIESKIVTENGALKPKLRFHQ